jgi:hypothetical protein
MLIFTSFSDLIFGFFKLYTTKSISFLGIKFIVILPFNVVFVHINQLILNYQLELINADLKLIDLNSLNIYNVLSRLDIK